MPIQYCMPDVARDGRNIALKFLSECWRAQSSKKEVLHPNFSMPNIFHDSMNILLVLCSRFLDGASKTLLIDEAQTVSCTISASSSSGYSTDTFQIQYQAETMHNCTIWTLHSFCKGIVVECHDITST